MKTMRALGVLLSGLALASLVSAQTPPPLPAFGAEILAKTQTLRLSPDLSTLSAGERRAVEKLLAAGEVFQRLYESSRHAQALSVRDGLQGDAATLYRLFQGPIATTLENKRQPFLGVGSVVPGKNVYPRDVTREEIEAFLAANPGARAEILDARTVVRRADATSIALDRAMFARHPVLAGLHPELAKRLHGMSPGTGFYAVPYAVAYADDLVAAAGLLREAADAIEGSDAEFARYLRNRSRDLLSNDYESGDASWVTGRFGRLNVEVGAYETYDDELYGVKAFHALSLLSRDEAASAELVRALGGLQAIQDHLPMPPMPAGAPPRRIREDIPVGVYEVIADFGQARGGNTATILPNDALFSRRYGRTILMRANILRHPDLFAQSDAAWKAAVSPPFGDQLTADGGFQRTLWHEIGHYLGVDRDRQGRDLDVALEEWADLFEEMKADLVSLAAGRALAERGYYDANRLRGLYASGVRRVLNVVKPRRDQPYQTMQLLQFNYFVEKGLLGFDPKGALTIDYGRYPEVVRSLLGEVLKLQFEGDKAAAEAFIEKYGGWDAKTNEAIATRMRAAQRYRYQLYRYAALGE